MSLLASTAFADDKLENPSAPADAPVAAPSKPAAPSAPPAVPSAPIAKTEAKIDPLANVPAKCAPIAKRIAIPNTMQAMSARISLAGCLADERLAPLQLLDSQESMLEVEAAIAPSVQLLDDVIARGDVQSQLLAHHAKMQIVQQSATRMLQSVPAAAQPTVEAAQLRDSRRALVEAMITPWRAQIADEARATNEIARANPKLAKNAAVMIALRDAKAIAPETIAASGETKQTTADNAPASETARPSSSNTKADSSTSPTKNNAGTAEATLR